MPTYTFPTNIAVGDLGQVTWANSVSAALNDLGPLVDAKAADDAVVKLTGDQTVAGVKTFSSAPSVPDSSFEISKTTGLQTALNAKAPLASPTFTGTVSGITKAMVGLSNVDNTTDANKPISSATQTALNAKAPLASPTFTGTVGGITKAMVGLSNVDNTSDANKPISTAAQTALNLKAPLESPAFTGTPTGITKSHVGLSNVDNTSDANKPVSTATQTALDGKSGTSHTHVASSITDFNTSVDSRITASGKVGSANASVNGIEYYATVEDLPSIGTVGVLYFVDGV